MVTNAMFYELADAKENFKLKFGPINFTWRELIIGVQSSLIVLPVNLLIITIFRYTAPEKSCVGEATGEPRKQDSKGATKEKSEQATKDKTDKTSKETKKTKTDLKSKEPTKTEKSKGKKGLAEPYCKGNEAKSIGRRTTPQLKRKKKLRLPHWFNYVGYTLALLTSFTGAMFTMFYSMIWGKEKSDKWITSVIVSLVQDIVFLQPLKVVLLASILAILFRKPPEEERDEVEDDELLEMKKGKIKDATPDEDKTKNTKPVYSLPDPIEVALAREKRLNQVKMAKIFSQVGLQLFFVLLLSIATYGSRSVDRFFLSKNIQDVFNTKLDKVSILW